MGCLAKFHDSCNIFGLSNSSWALAHMQQTLSQLTDSRKEALPRVGEGAKAAMKNRHANTCSVESGKHPSYLERKPRPRQLWQCKTVLAGTQAEDGSKLKADQSKKHPFMTKPTAMAAEDVLSITSQYS